MTQGSRVSSLLPLVKQHRQIEIEEIELNPKSYLTPDQEEKKQRETIKQQREKLRSVDFKYKDKIQK